MKDRKKGKIGPLDSVARLRGQLDKGRVEMPSTGSAIKENGLFCLKVEKGKDFIHQGG